MPAGTDHFTETDLDALIPEIWGEKLNDFFREDLVLGSFFTDRSEELADGGDTLHTPNLTEMSANEKTTNSQVTLNSPTETNTDLVVDTWAEVSFLIEDREKAQVKKSYPLQERYVKNAAHTAASEIEDAIASIFSTFTTTVGTFTTALTDENIRASIAAIRAANIPGISQSANGSGDVAFILHPNVVWNQVMGIDKFTLVQNTMGADPVIRGAVGYLYGIPVIDTDNVPSNGDSTGYNNALAHKDAIHWARLTMEGSENAYQGEMGIRLQTNYIPEYLGFLSTADVVYGVTKNRDEAGVNIRTQV